MERIPETQGRNSPPYNTTVIGLRVSKTTLKLGSSLKAIPTVRSYRKNLGKN